MAQPTSANMLAQITFDGQLCGQLILNSFCYQLTTRDPTKDVVDETAALYTRVTQANGVQKRFLNVVPPSYEMNNIIIQMVAPTRLRSTKIGVGVFGLSAFDANTANTAMVVTREGDFASRKAQSSLHIPYSNLDNTNTDGTISAGLLSGLNLLAAQMILTLVGAGTSEWTPVIRNKPFTAINATTITGAFGQKTIRIMRRRTVGVGK